MSERERLKLYFSSRLSSHHSRSNLILLLLAWKLLVTDFFSASRNDFNENILLEEFNEQQHSRLFNPHWMWQVVTYCTAFGAQIYEFFDNAKVSIRFKAYAAKIGGCQRSEDGGSVCEGSIDTAGA